jgi:phenylalanyl-tRNA synthetase beta chain
MQHGLKTDASFRFERGTDPNMVIIALQYAALLIKEVAGGLISSQITDVYPTPLPDFEVTVKYKNIHRLIGNEIPQERIKEILKGLQIRILQETAEGLVLAVPPFRVDVTREADVIEDILRIYGFNSVTVPPYLGASYLADAPLIDKDLVRNELSRMLAGAGMFEIITNSLTKPEYAALSSDFEVLENVEILNKLSTELGVMRQSLLFSGLEVIGYNINRKQTELKLFEFGKTYKKTEGKYKETERLALFISGNKNAESWIAKSQKCDYHTLASLLQKILFHFNVETDTTELKSDCFAYGLQVGKGNKTYAKIGLVKPTITKYFGIKQDVFYAEIDWLLLTNSLGKRVNYQEIPKFPEVRRDLSLVIDKKVSFAEIQKIAYATERKLLKAMNVFDVYEGENIGTDKKSYSVSFILSDSTQTLTDAVTDKTMSRLIEIFEKELGAIIRK